MVKTRHKLPAGRGHARRSAGNGTMSFRDILERSREDAAVTAWRRAAWASVVRHAVRTPAARERLSEIKFAAIANAATLAPQLVRHGIDGDLHLGLPTVSFGRHGRLHVPWDHAVVGSRPLPGALAG